MSHTSIILYSLFLVAMAIYVTPSVVVLNQGKMLRNMALWVAVFLGLMIIYKNFGPGSDHPLFHDTLYSRYSRPSAASDKTPATTAPADDKGEGSQGFTPPSE